MKILFLTMGYPSVNNPSHVIFLQRLVNALVDQNHCCTVIAPVKCPGEKPVPGNMEVHRTKRGKTVNVYFPQYLCAWLESRFKHDFIEAASVRNYIYVVEKTIKNNGIKFDCIYSHFLGISALAATRLGSKYRVPVFAAAGESRFPFLENMDKARTISYLNKLNGIISVSTQNKRLLLENGILEDRKIAVFPNGIDTDVFYPRDKDAAREKFGFSKEDFIISFTGHFIDRKGPLRVMKASLDAGVKAAYAGKGPETPDAENTVWCGPVVPEDMPILLSASDVFVLPTRSEGCCNAIIEALACGVPVISSDLPFNDDILDEKCSIRINPDDIEEISKAIDLLANDPDRRAMIAAAAYEKGRKLSLPERANRIALWMENNL